MSDGAALDRELADACRRVYAHYGHDLERFRRDVLADIGGGSLPNTTPDLAPLEALAKEWDRIDEFADSTGWGHCADELHAILAQMKEQS